MRVTSAATLPLPITTARSDERSGARSRWSGWPLYQATNSVAARLPGQVLAGDAERLVGLRAGGVDDRAVVLHQVAVRDVDADLDVAEEAAAALERVAVERVLQPLDLLVVGRDAAAQQPPRRGQPLEQVDLDVAAGAQQGRRREGPRRPGADDRDARSHGVAHAAVRSAVLCSAKNSAFRPRA